MKRVLFVNNYSMKQSLDWAKKGILPRHHCWGGDFLEEKAKVDYFVVRMPHFVYKLHIARIWYYIQNVVILLKAIKCDVIYVGASPLVDLIGYLKYKGLYKKRVIVIVHHPGNFSLNKQRYDKLIFICRMAYDKALLDYPHCKDMFLFQSWGPDLSFYKDGWARNQRRKYNEVSFFSNGNTDRDNYTLAAAAKKVEKERVGILCSKQYVPDNYDLNIKNIILNKVNNGRIMSGKMLTYKKMIEWILDFSVCVIPTKKDKATLCGLTSFCDAIALGMPVLLADTTHIYVDFKKHPFGCYYEAGNVDDLAEKMKWFSGQHVDDLERMSHISRSYAEENNYDKFAEIVCREVLE